MAVISSFVAGATGYTGREVVAELCRRARGPVLAHVRPDSSRRESWTKRFEEQGARVDTTAWKLDAMAETMARERPRLVFSLLGTTRARARLEGRSAGDAYQAIDYGLTALLIDAVARSGHACRFVYLSAAGLREDTKNPYMKARVDAEAHLRRSGIEFTVVRPSFISGSDRDETRPGERVGAVVADGLLAVAGALGARGLRDRYASMTGADLARALVDVAMDPAHEGATLHAEALRARQ